MTAICSSARWALPDRHSGRVGPAPLAPRRRHFASCGFLLRSRSGLLAVEVPDAVDVTAAGRCSLHARAAIDASAGRLEASVLRMSPKKIFGGLVGVAMLLGGGFLALAGMGYIGEAAGTSGSWSVIGSLLAGLGVALLITIFQRRH